MCSLQSNAVYHLALVTQVPSLPLSVGYQNQKCLCPELQELNISPFNPQAANYIQGCRETLGLLADWLVWRLSTPLSVLFCLCAFDRLHQTEGSQSRELPSVSLTHITLGLYHITSQYKRTQRTAGSLLNHQVPYIQQSSPQPKGGAGPQIKECGSGDGRTRTGHSNKPRLPVECWDADLWVILMERWANLRLSIKQDCHYPPRP